MFSIFSGGLILLRGEFFLIYLLTLIFFFIKKKSKFILISSLISLLITSPYLIRNYVVFDSIGITKSSGYNLWKGNNINSTIEGSDKITSKYLQEKISNIKVDSNYEIKLDKIFKEEAVNNIKKEPSRYFGLYVKKFFHLSFLIQAQLIQITIIYCIFYLKFVYLYYALQEYTYLFQKTKN